MKKCRYCKRPMYDDAFIHDLVKYHKTERQEHPKNDPDHESVVVIFKQNVFHGVCGHIAYVRYINIRVVYDGQHPSCWIIDSKENK